MLTALQSMALDPAESIERISHGLPWSAAEELAALLDVSMARLGELLQISPATLTRRKGSRFAPQESDRILRYVRIWNLACDAVGGPEGARSWLTRPQFGLNGAVPLDLARFEAGGRQVEKLLERILYGVLA